MKKKVKSNNKWYVVLAIFFVVLIISILYLFKENKVITNNNGYQNKVMEVFKKHNVDLLVQKEPYSKTLEETVLKDFFNPMYINDYLSIDYRNDDNYLIEINKLLNNGYQAGEINNIYKLYDKDIVLAIVNRDKFNLILLVSKNFELNNLDRYISYLEKSNKTPAEVVTSVNIGLDKSFYSDYKVISKPEETTVLLNKYNQLPNDYVPADLENITSSMQISKRAKEPLMNMVAAAKEAGHILCYYSGYRSYSRQVSLYNNYVKRDGKEAADLYSARPGFSEHQTGLTMDLCTENGKTVKEKDPVYTWLKDNAHNYGFIIRYPKGKTDITGYQFEPWHFRFIGIEHATKLHSLNITYDEYYDLYIKER